LSDKIALITGVTGQDGSLLARLLLDKGYIVHGMKRRSSLFNTERIDDIYVDPHESDPQLFLHYGELTDTTSLIRLLQEIRPDEVYNLAAQSHVQVSFETPEYTANTDGVGTLRLLEAIRLLRLKDTKFYQASTSEMYGNATKAPQRETTPFSPCSPYGTAKLYAYWITVNYRDAYGIFASNGILFNHESPVRGETFVTRKISRAVAAIELGLQERLHIGNLDAKRDWGHARDFVKGEWQVLQQPCPHDFVMATGGAIQCESSSSSRLPRWVETSSGMEGVRKKPAEMPSQAKSWLVSTPATSAPLRLTNFAEMRTRRDGSWAGNQRLLFANSSRKWSDPTWRPSLRNVGEKTALATDGYLHAVPAFSLDTTTSA